MEFYVWALLMPIDKSVYVISSSMNKQISKIIVEVLQILGIPLIDLIRFYSVPIIQTKRWQFSEEKGMFTSGKNVFTTPICSDESSNMKFLIQ